MRPQCKPLAAALARASCGSVIERAPAPLVNLLGSNINNMPARLAPNLDAAAAARPELAFSQNPATSSC
jgi:hypothetical protein